MLRLLSGTDSWALAQICVDHIQITKEQYLSIFGKARMNRRLRRGGDRDVVRALPTRRGAGLSHGDRLDVGASLLGRREPVGVFPPSFSASER